MEVRYIERQVSLSEYKNASAGSNHFPGDAVVEKERYTFTTHQNFIKVMLLVKSYSTCHIHVEVLNYSFSSFTSILFHVEIRQSLLFS